MERPYPSSTSYIQLDCHTHEERSRSSQARRVGEHADRPRGAGDGHPDALNLFDHTPASELSTWTLHYLPAFPIYRVLYLCDLDPRSVLVTDLVMAQAR
jgi:hypothetical protein